MIAATKHPLSPWLEEAMRMLPVKDGILYNYNYIDFANYNMIRAQKLKIQHVIKLARHTGQGN